MKFNFTMFYGIPILSVRNSVSSTEGIFHQAFVQRAAKYRVKSTTSLIAGQSVEISCFFLWMFWSWPVISTYVYVNEWSYAIKEQSLLEINGIHGIL